MAEASMDQDRREAFSLLRGDLPHRVLGRTGVSVPIVGLGTAPAGHRPRDEAVALYHACIDRGLTLFDTGPSEGGWGQAQHSLGQVLRERRDEVFVATKCGQPDGDKALISLRQSLTDLQIERADLVYVQSIGDDLMAPRTIYAADGVCRAMEKARDDGLTRFLGVSGHCRPGRFLTALEEWDFDVMMTPVNLVSRLAHDFERLVWPAAAARNIGLVAMKAYGGVSDSKRSIKGALIPDHLKPSALRYTLSTPDLACVVIGMHDRSELEQNLAWIEDATPLVSAELAALEKPARALVPTWLEAYGPRD